MKIRVVVVGLVLGFLGFACSSSSSDTPAGAGGGGGSGSLNPPANIDVTSCASHPFSDPSCQTCCTAAGFDASSSYNDACLCAKAMNPPDTTTCATATTATCFDCCMTADYNGAASGTAGCSCTGKSDSAVCAGSVSDSDACHVCCLNHGYFVDFFSNIGSPACTCRDV